MDVATMIEPKLSVIPESFCIDVFGVDMDKGGVR